MLLLFFLIRFLGLFEKKQVFVLFLEKNTKILLNCLYCIRKYHHFQNYTIITCYTYYGIQI